ncbi:TipC family immunity protein [Criibacterium bergeronii]|uniref:TipC family immunity protein n=1 Tax=Criibacterium bergeronii TaxID=1871336 RepID=A0A552UX09_9FIRM|nr:TipC family immunity protein [Criibacterium bergeronii]TRW22690.1 TipC family immunity protein [Criibacterium bergeronii]
MNKAFVRKNRRHKISVLKIILLGIIIIFLYRNFIIVQNVFDKIYYSRAFSDITINEIRPKSLDYINRDAHNMPILLRGISLIPKWSFEQEYKINDIYDGGKVRVVISETSPYEWIYEDSKDFTVKDNGGMTFYYDIWYEQSEEKTYEDSINLGYRYNVYKKKLEDDIRINRYFSENHQKDVEYSNYEDAKHILLERGLTKEYLEEKRHWMLYEKILPDWFEANKYFTRFSMNNLGNVKIVEDEESI